MTDSKKTDTQNKNTPLSKEDLSLWQEAMRDTKRQIEKSPTKIKKTAPEEKKSLELSQEDKELWAQFTQSLNPLEVSTKPPLMNEEVDISKEDYVQPLPQKKQIRALNVDLPVDIDKRT
ncbi:MAG: hypothetical protein Q8K37_04055, partial [Alphaproteobacteria bacterium]|nr:hypothetical protein [Alphaproteobacteria bacterium]